MGPEEQAREEEVTERPKRVEPRGQRKPQQGCFQEKRVKVLDHLVTERGTLCSLMLDPSIREASGQSCFLVHSPVANV